MKHGREDYNLIPDPLGLTPYQVIPTISPEDRE